MNIDGIKQITLPVRNPISMADIVPVLVPAPDLPEFVVLAQKYMIEKIAKMLVCDEYIIMCDGGLLRQTEDILTSIGVIHKVWHKEKQIVILDQTDNALDIQYAKLKKILFPYRQLVKFTIGIESENFDFIITFSKDIIIKALGELFPKYEIDIQYWTDNGGTKLGRIEGHLKKI
jgi:hypothetical protein